MANRNAVTAVIKAFQEYPTNRVVRIKCVTNGVRANRLIVVGVLVPQFLFGKYMKSLENKSRSLLCSSEYADEHKRVGKAWLKNALPDF